MGRSGHLKLQVLLLCVLILFSQPVITKTLVKGGALKFHNVTWYHFPKTGGTTMRSLLHKVAVLEHFNMTTAYGLKDECTTLPFSCNIGSRAFITYGHLRDQFVINDPNNLRVMMIREPQSWLLSRMQHETRKMKKSTGSMEMTAALIRFGPKYFNFLSDSSRAMAMRWFDRLVKPSAKSSASGVSEWDVLEAIESDFRSNVFVLDTAHYSDSLRLLACAFDSPHFLSTGKGEALPKINEAFTWQMREPAGSLEEVKQLSRLLETHNAVYNIALREFFRQRKHMCIA